MKGFYGTSDGRSYIVDVEQADSTFTVAWLVKFCEDNGIDPETAEVEGAYGEPTTLTWRRGKA